jgi:hypothetical protein
MEKISRFTIDESNAPIPTDPESLFRDLKRRSPKIQYLWSHQAEVLRTWHQKCLNESDVALELPTGTGKTLVGLLAAEYRRQVYEERVLYLCLTRQLANQVEAQAQEYGIQAFCLIGDQTKYSPAAYGAYASGKAIGITTYNGIFNTHPRLNDSNCIILDDAHSSEGYIASLWSLEIRRRDQEKLYSSVLDIFRDALREQFVAHLEDTAPDPMTIRRNVDKVPFPIYSERTGKLLELIRAANDERCRYPLLMIQDHLQSCNMFISWSSICIRPIIPPTLIHAPFASAKQRIYMSATLGAGGELERIIGVPHILRLPAPEGWDRQSTGRRFFMLPGCALNEENVDTVMWQSIGSVDKALVLCPDWVTANRFEKSLEKSGIDRQVMTAPDIEDSLDAFCKSTKTLLLLAGRYDGIDLSGQVCRLLVVLGLPAALNAQEEFLSSRLGTTSLLRDRIRTRLTQAFGRCTRGPTDFTAVLLIGSDLIDFCFKKETRAAMHPELQAEIEYGLKMSTTMSDVSERIELLLAFLAQQEDWRTAEVWIRGFRDKTKRLTEVSADALLAVAPQEVEFIYYLWKGDYEEALTKARTIADSLGGKELTGYRAWWYYLAGSVAWSIAQLHKDEKSEVVAKELYERATKCPTAVSWFSDLTRMKIINQLTKEIDILTSHSIENIEDFLTNLGLVGPKFEKSITEFIELINNNEYKQFERGLEILGKSLGFKAWRPESQGSPDCIWQLSDKVCIAFEAKSEENPGVAIPIRDAREAKGHIDWVKDQVKLSENPTILAIMVSPRSSILKDAVIHANGVFYIHVDEIRKLAQLISGVLRGIRAMSSESSEEILRTNILERLNKENLCPTNLLESLKKTKLKDLPPK